MSTPNYETFQVQITLDSDAVPHNSWMGRARFWAGRHQSTSEVWTLEESARFNLADELKEAISNVEAYTPKLADALGSEYLYWTLLNSALERVDWCYLAGTWLDSLGDA